jgi:glycosyltransferase involved in cell wall biosynthesis
LSPHGTYLADLNGVVRVTLSAAFAGGAFYYAEQLDRRKNLHLWLTSRPDARRTRVDGAKIRVNVLPEIADRLPRLLPWFRSRVPGRYVKAEMFDLWAARRLTECDVVVAFADFALRTMRRARQLAAVSIVERGSAHILLQKEIMEEEHRRFSDTPVRIDERLVAKQLQEYEEADYIAVPSTFARDSYLARGVPPDKLICVPIGVDLERFQAVPKTDRVFRILAVAGGLRKGCQYLLEAVRQLRLPNCEVLLLGGAGGELDRVLAKYRDLFRDVGKIPHHELYRWYSQGSVFVSPSVEDGWGLVVNEAMACGLPVICSTNTGARDMVRDGVDGYVVATRDVAALKDRLLYLHAHEHERTAMAQSALQRVREFTWDRYGERIAREYRRVADLRVRHR